MNEPIFDPGTSYPVLIQDLQLMKTMTVYGYGKHLSYLHRYCKFTDLAKELRDKIIEGTHAEDRAQVMAGTAYANSDKTVIAIQYA